MQDLKVVLVQTVQFWEDKKANFKYLEQMHFSKIKPGKCDLILLPEMFNTGFSMNVIELAEDMEGESVMWLKNKAKELDCQIGTSLIIKEQNSFYNRFIIVSKNGIEAHYDKRHLFRMGRENEFFKPGQKRVTHKIKEWTILLQICYDLRFPVFSRNRNIVGKKEYDLVVYIANWPEKRNTAWSVLLQARAIENQSYCIGLNRVGEDGMENSYSGDSAAIDPWGDFEFQATKNTETVQILTLSAAKLSDINIRFPAYKDAD